jgi:hypothetical protein
MADEHDVVASEDIIARSDANDGWPYETVKARMIELCGVAYEYRRPDGVCILLRPTSITVVGCQHSCGAATRAALVAPVPDVVWSPPND